MDSVRREMALLTDVDQPGSAIDQYVEKLDAILLQKMDGIVQLKGKLDRFKEHLKQEEVSGSVVQQLMHAEWARAGLEVHVVERGGACGRAAVFFFVFLSCDCKLQASCMTGI